MPCLNMHSEISVTTLKQNSIPTLSDYLILSDKTESRWSTLSNVPLLNTSYVSWKIKYLQIILRKNHFMCSMQWMETTRLCPYILEPTRLCSDTFVPTHVYAQKCLCPHTFVPRHVYAQTCLCTDTVVPRTRLCPHTYLVPWHVIIK